MPVDQTPPDTHPQAQATHSKAEIARILGLIVAHKAPVKSYLEDGKRLFQSTLLHVDPELRYIFLAPGPDEAANASLCARPRCTFFCSLSTWSIEFVAAGPQRGRQGDIAAIRFAFPEVLVSLQRREEPRASLPLGSLHCVADAGGLMSFDSQIVDISVNGVGFLVYDPSITLEPGTVLRGCRITLTGMAPVLVDLEVRYSEPVTASEGKLTQRSGCRVIDPPQALVEFIENLAHKPAGTGGKS